MWSILIAEHSRGKQKKKRMQRTRIVRLLENDITVSDAVWRDTKSLAYREQGFNTYDELRSVVMGCAGKNHQMETDCGNEENHLGGAGNSYNALAVALHSILERGSEQDNQGLGEELFPEGNSVRQRGSTIRKKRSSRRKQHGHNANGNNRSQKPEMRATET